MLALPSTVSTLAARADADARLLLTLEFSTPTPATFRFSDQHLEDCGGYEWLPFVLQWGQISERVDLQDNLTVSPGTFDVVLDNARPLGVRTRLSDYVRTPENTRGAYEWVNAKATLACALSPTAVPGELVTLGVYYVEDPVDVGRTSLRLRMSDLALQLEEKFGSLKVTSETFSNAPPSALGVRVPVLFGDFTAAGARIKATPVVAGRHTTLTAAVTAGQTTPFSVDSAAGFPTSGTIMINGEMITYAATTATTFQTSIVRAAKSTTATSHEIGDDVFEVRSGTSAYRYAVGLNILGGVKQVSSVRASGATPTLAATARLAVTTLATGHSLAMVDFDLTDAGTNVRQFHLAPRGYEPPASFETTTQNQSAILNPASTASGTFAFTFPAAVTAAAFRRARVTMKLLKNSGGALVTAYVRYVDVNGQTIMTFADDAGTPTSAEFTIPSYQTTLTVYYYVEVSGSGQQTITAVTCVQEADTISGTESTAAAVIGDVDALVQGIQDDAAGSISGTPALLLENPADIMRAVVTELYGVSASDLGPTWAAARSRYAAAGHEWAVQLDEDKFSTLRSNFLRCGRALLYFSNGRAELKYLDAGPAPDASIAYDSGVSAETPAVLRRSGVAQLWNSVTVKSRYDPANGTFRYSSTWVDLVQPGLTIERAINLELLFVQDTAMTDAYGRFWRDQWKRQRLETEVADAWWSRLTLQLGDVVVLTGHSVLAAHGGDGVTFRIVARQLDPAQGTVTLSLREAANLHWDREYFAGAVLDEPRVVPALIPVQYAQRERVRARRDPRENIVVYGGRNRLLSAMGG